MICIPCEPPKKYINKNILCIELECNIRSNFNFEGQTKGLYCRMHKKENMININDKSCIESGCKTTPSFNFEGENKRLYCALHKKSNMVEVNGKRCIEENCKTTPNFNFDKQTKGLYCSIHKLEGMTNIRANLCLENECNNHAIYNIEGNTNRLYCSLHKKENMIQISIKKCMEIECKTRPIYNIEGETKGIYCASHKKQNMINVVTPTCKTYLCNTQVQNKYEGYCLVCYIHLFPDQPVTRNYKTKERATVEYILEKFKDYTWIADKKVQDGCSRRRPDLLLDLGYQIIIIEVDENQHIDYDCSCENKRIMEISQDLGHRPIIFIRFNPDDYNLPDKKITSCWGINQKSICTIKKSKKKEWIERLETLQKQVEYWTIPQNKTDKMIEVIQLFYDK